MPKCFYYLIKWAFTSKVDPYPVDHEFNIEIMDHTERKRIRIQQKPGVEPHCTLGAYLAPDSKHVSKLLSKESKAKKGDPPIPTLEQGELQRKAMEFQRGIYANHLNKYEGQLMHRQIYTPSMKYGLHILNTEDAFMAKTQGGVSEALLTAMGYNRKMPKAI